MVSSNICILSHACSIAGSLVLLRSRLPVIKEDKKCIGLNKVVWTIAVVSRSVIDVVFLVHFVVECMMRRDEGNNESNTITTCWEKLKKVRGQLWFIMLNVQVILPIPQVRETKLHCKLGKYYFHVFF